MIEVGKDIYFLRCNELIKNLVKVVLPTPNSPFISNMSEGIHIAANFSANLLSPSKLVLNVIIWYKFLLKFFF